MPEKTLAASAVAEIDCRIKTTHNRWNISEAMFAKICGRSL